MKSQLHMLRLVYPPVSNQEAEWIKSDVEVQKQLERSNLYMIAQRREANYTEFQQSVRNSGDVKFNFNIEGVESDEVIIDCNEILKNRNVFLETDEIELEWGDKKFKLWKCDQKSEPAELIEWFTTEKLLFDRWRQNPGIYGLKNYRKFTNYYLHYIGVSKRNDSLTRLIKNAHEKRIQILSNEHPIAKTSRLSDEIYMFFFEVEPLRVNVIGIDDERTDIKDVNFDKKKIIADAEKALINIMKPKYNEIIFSQYPKGKDGLYEEGFDRYVFSIAEDISFETKDSKITGGYLTSLHEGEAWFVSNDADGILIEGENIEFFKAEDLKRWTGNQT